MAKELAKRASGLTSTTSSGSTAGAGGLSTQPGQLAYDEVPEQPQDDIGPSDEVLAERASRAGKLVGGISSGGLSTRSSRKAYEEVKSPYEELRKPGTSPLKVVREDAEVSRTQPY